MTNPTAAAVPSTSPLDLLFNAEKLDEAINTGALSYVDRKGVSRKTLAGAVATISAVNPRGAWTTATAYLARDVVSNSGTWYIALDNHTSGATFAGDQTAHWRVYQGVISTELADSTDASKGAGLSGLGPSLNYAVSTLGHWATKVLTDFNVFKWITPSEWAAILNGTSTFDAASAWASAINAAGASGRNAVVSGPTGRYYFSTVIGTFAFSNVTVDLNGSHFDGPAISLAETNPFLSFEGSYGTGVALTANAAANQKTLSFTSTGFAVGDYVRIYSEAVVDPSRTASKTGEVNIIKTIPGGTSATTELDLRDTYNTADTARIAKLTPVRNVVIQNGRITGPAGNDEMLGLRFRVAIDCEVRGIRSFDMDRIHLQFTDCFRCFSRGNFFEQSNHASMGYGVSFADATRGCGSFGDTFTNVRHSMSTNNTASSYGMVREIQFRHFTVYASQPATGGSGGDAVDTHACAEDINIGPGVIYGASNAGINFEARSGSIVDVTLKGCVSVGIYANNYTDRKGQIVIANCKGDQVGDGSGTDPFIFVHARTNSGGYDRAVLDGNECAMANGSEFIRVQGLSANKITGLAISGGSGKTSGATVLQLRDVQRSSVSGGSYESGGFSPVLLQDVDTTSLGGQMQINVTRLDAATVAYMVRLIGTGTRNQVGNLIGNLIGGGYTTSHAVHLADTITQTQVFNINCAGLTNGVTLGAGAGNTSTNVLT